jgi:hypothetical protein
MTTKRKLNATDLTVVRATWEAIASAEGWCREFPVSLSGCVSARLSQENPGLIYKLDDSLREEMQPESQRLESEEAAHIGIDQ